MNRHFASALVLASAAAGNAFANEIMFDPTPFNPTRTRAEVRAELAQFRASGIDPWAQDYNPLAHFSGRRSREAVVAEYLVERDTVAAFTGEDSGSMHLGQRQAPQPAPSYLAGLPAAAEAE